MTPTEPQDPGWQLPTSTPQSRDRWDLIVRGTLVAGGLAFAVTASVAEVWSTCDDLPPGAGMALMFGLFPILTAAIAGVVAGGLLVMHGHPPRARFLVGTALGVVASAILVMFLVRGGTGIAQPVDPLFPACGANGLPTWWPTWLPS